MNLYVLRHGQTDYNIEGKFQGQVDIKMNEIGEKQTDEIALELKKIKFDIIFCSPLTRTIDTAKKINKNIKTEERIIERSFGQLEGKKGISNYENYIEKYEIETIENLKLRIFDFLNEIMEKYKKLENILIVTHEGVAQIINWYFNANIDEIKKFRLEPAKYVKYEI